MRFRLLRLERGSGVQRGYRRTGPGARLQHPQLLLLAGRLDDGKVPVEPHPQHVAAPQGQAHAGVHDAPVHPVQDQVFRLLFHRFFFFLLGRFREVLQDFA
uniref:(northern house mosquito) hypothetical protein n=1 Tax=Culex pipiens TaxID=7175 RepID=A0A8D8HQB4_CULPI